MEIQYHTVSFFFLHKRNGQLSVKLMKYLIQEAKAQEEGKNGDDEDDEDKDDKDDDKEE